MASTAAEIGTRLDRSSTPNDDLGVSMPSTKDRSNTGTSLRGRMEEKEAHLVARNGVTRSVFEARNSLPHFESTFPKSRSLA